MIDTAQLAFLFWTAVAIVLMLWITGIVLDVVQDSLRDDDEEFPARVDVKCLSNRQDLPRPATGDR